MREISLQMEYSGNLVSKKNEISGVKLFSLEVKANRIILNSDLGHLLRRLGQVEVRKVLEQDGNEFTLRAVADDVWIPLDGSMDIILVDRRPGSPTEDMSLKINLDVEDEQGILIPFGVAYSIVSMPDAQMLRLSTHRDESHDEDQLISAKTLSHLLADL